MKIELNKNELYGALSALGKLVSRTSPIEAYRSVEIRGGNDTITFRTATMDETIVYQVPAAGTEEFTSLVLFDTFRNAVKGCKTKEIELEWNGTFLVLDGTVMPGVGDNLPILPEIPATAETSSLPENFAELLNIAAPIVNRNDYRKVLQGINLSRDGIVATNGKELFHIPLPLTVESLTIPFPLSYMATHAHAEGRLSAWRDADAQRFRVTAGNWTWGGRALKGTYPNWHPIVPERTTLPYTLKLAEDGTEQLKNWLKIIPEDAAKQGFLLSQISPDTMKACNQQGMEFRIPAEFPNDWGDYTLAIGRDILLRLLSQGHSKLACPAEHGPFIASGGIGEFIAMPLLIPKAHNEPKTEPKTEPQTEPTKTEEKKMTEITTTVVPAVQVVTTNPEVELNPMEELTDSIEAFKTKLKGMLDESNVLSRKVREVALSQKQKERDFIQAKRAIERIRMAI